MHCFSQSENAVSRKVAVLRKEENKMKFYLKIFALVLALVFAVSVFAGCDNKPEEGSSTQNPSGEQPTNGGDNGTGDEPDEPVVEFPDIERQNYGEDVNTLVVYASNPGEFFIVDDEQNDGSVMAEAVYARQQQVEDYLGVKLIRKALASPDDWMTYNRDVSMAVTSKDGSLEGLLTHVYGCIPAMITENYLMDLNEVEGIDLNASYWKLDVMEKLEVNGALYLGRSDLNILKGYIITFNKDLMERYSSYIEKPVYDLVRDYEWTLDAMMNIARLSYHDRTGDGKTGDDTFGLIGCCGTAFAGIVQSCNIPLAQKASNGSYELAFCNETYNDKTFTLVEKFRTYEDEECTYFEKANLALSEREVLITTGRTLMSIDDVYRLEQYRKESDVSFGVLPFPMFDTAQKEVGYKTLDWGGNIAILSYQKNMDKVAYTFELLSYWSADVTVAYYEKLLGKQLADVPDDAEMLGIIWDSIEADPALTFSNVSGGTNASGITYILPELMDSSEWPAAGNGYASYVETKGYTFENGFLTFIEGLNS